MPGDPRPKTPAIILTLALLATSAAAAPAAADSGEPPPGDGQEAEVLVFSKTAGFRHGSIEAGIELITGLGAEHGFGVTATEDASVFSDRELDAYDAVVWLSTTGDVLDSGQQEAFERYISDGGGYAGVHAASDTEYEWAWYGGLVGAYFDSHPHVQEADVVVEDHGHPATAHLPDTWTVTDEWYNFRENPRGDVQVLASLDEEGYEPGDGAMGDHPISWFHEYDGGRAFYTGLGHETALYGDPDFQHHLLGGIQYAAGMNDPDGTH